MISLFELFVNSFLDFQKYRLFLKPFPQIQILADSMWSKCFASSFRKAASYARHTNSSLSMKMAQERFQSSGASKSAWKNGMILGAGALGLTCAYLTHKTFAENQDPVSCYWLFVIEIE